MLPSSQPKGKTKGSKEKRLTEGIQRSQNGRPGSVSPGSDVWCILEAGAPSCPPTVIRSVPWIRVSSLAGSDECNRDSGSVGALHKSTSPPPHGESHTRHKSGNLNCNVTSSERHLEGCGFWSAMTLLTNHDAATRMIRPECSESDTFTLLNIGTLAPAAEFNNPTNAADHKIKTYCFVFFCK